LWARWGLAPAFRPQPPDEPTRRPNHAPATAHDADSRKPPSAPPNDPLTDADFIIAMMKTETDALGFIPAPAIRDRWIPKGRYIIQRDRRGRRRGYLLHGAAKRGQPLFINQVCINYDHRLHGFAQLALRELLRRADVAGCTEIRLRCAQDLPANHFWTHSGFVPQTPVLGGKRRHRIIVPYRRTIYQGPNSR